MVSLQIMMASGMTLDMTSKKLKFNQISQSLLGMPHLRLP